MGRTTAAARPRKGAARKRPRRRSAQRASLLQRLGNETAPGRPLAIARLALAGRRGAAVSAPRYLRALERALADEFPPFASDVYCEMFRTAARSGQWLVIWLIHAAQEEGRRARRLGSLAAGGGVEARLLERHAVDESNHSLAYLKLMDLAFPGATPADFRAQLEQVSPRYATRRRPGAEGGGAAPLDAAGWIGLNLSELRTAVRHVLLHSVLSGHCARSRFARAAPVLEAMLRDELRHVGYSAEVIERNLGAGDADALSAALVRGMSKHVRATAEDAVDYQYHVRFGNYP